MNDWIERIHEEFKIQTEFKVKEIQDFSNGMKYFETVAGDVNGQKWKTWKRCFELFLLANKIEDDDEKVTLLLLKGGPIIQTLSDRLPNARARKFVWLREQGSLCDVDEVTLEIMFVDQIVDRELRNKIFKDNLDLNGILKQARILEGLSKQIKTFEINVEIGEVNRVEENKQRNYEFQKKRKFWQNGML